MHAKASEFGITDQGRNIIKEEKETLSDLKMDRKNAQKITFVVPESLLQAPPLIDPFPELVCY